MKGTATGKSSAILAGDIGGTKTNLALFDAESWPGPAIAEETFPSSDYPNLETLVKEFLAGIEYHVDSAGFGVAGPVVNGTAKITNLPWAMDEVGLAKALDLKSVRLINDVLALAHALPLLSEKDLHPIRKGRAVKGGALAVIAPGTGLGEAFLAWDGREYQAYASEGGHADFAPADSMQTSLLEYLRKKYGHVSYERVCSGSGLVNIYDFLKESGYGHEPEWLTEKLALSKDRTPVIVKAAMDETMPCPLCQETLKIFAGVLGAEAGNMALKIVASGGVYLGGGIPPRIIPALEGGHFLKAFGSKGRMSSLLEKIPMNVILNPKSALLGAAGHAIGQYLRTKASEDGFTHK